MAYNRRIKELFIQSPIKTPKPSNLVEMGQTVLDENNAFKLFNVTSNSSSE